MKKIVKTFAVSMTLIAALLVAVSVQAKDARLTGMTGTVEVLKDGGAWQKISSSKSIKEGETLRTADVVGTVVSFRLANADALVVMNQGSTLTLNQASDDTVNGQKISNTVMTLAAGQVTGKVGAIGGASKFTVNTPTKSFEVAPNSEFSISVDGAVTVSRGELTAKAGTETVKVAAGQTLAPDATATAPADANIQASISTQVAYAARDTVSDTDTQSVSAPEGRNQINPTLSKYVRASENKAIDDLLPKVPALGNPASNDPIPVTPYSI